MEEKKKWHNDKEDGAKQVNMVARLLPSSTRKTKIK